MGLDFNATLTKVQASPDGLGRAKVQFFATDPKGRTFRCVSHVSLGDKNQQAIDASEKTAPSQYEGGSPRMYVPCITTADEVLLHRRPGTITYHTLASLSDVLSNAVVRREVSPAAVQPEQPKAAPVFDGVI